LKSRTKSSETSWTLHGETITVFIPMTWKKRRRGQKVILAPDGSDVWAPAKARPDEMLIRALARAHRWNRMLDAGKCRSIAEIAVAEPIRRSVVNRLAVRGPRGPGCRWQGWAMWRIICSCPVPINSRARN
jgi:hypothetical protein